MTAVKRLVAEEERLRRRIEFAVRNLGDTAEDEELATKLLSDLRRQRATTIAEIKRHEAIRNVKAEIPDVSEIRGVTEKLSELLAAAATGVNDEQAPLVRRIIKIVTASRIDLYQQGERRPKRGWLQGRIRVKLLRLVLEQCTGHYAAPEEGPVEITVDYRQHALFDAEADQAWALYKEKKLAFDIAGLLGCSRSKVT